MHGRWSGVLSGRVNPLVPCVVALVGAGVFVVGSHAIGVGVAIGACLGLLNGMVLSRRVDMAADLGDVGRALLAMQLTLLLSCTVIGIATVILVRFSVAMAVASAAGFAVSHFGILGTYYFAHGRVDTALEGKSS